jgi:hypothetical protein
MHLESGRSAGKNAYTRMMVVSRPKVGFWPDGNTSPGSYGWFFVSRVHPNKEAECNLRNVRF